MPAPIEVRAFGRVVLDRLPVRYAAAELQTTPDQIELLVARERRMRQRAGTLPIEPRSIVRELVGEEQRVCETHGPYLAQQQAIAELPPRPTWTSLPLDHLLIPHWSQCPQCDRIAQAEADSIEEAIRSGQSQKKRASDERLIAAGIPERFRDAEVATWRATMDQQKRVQRWAREYAGQWHDARRHGRCGVFCGGPGTGKTHLAIGLLRHVIEQGGSGTYTTVMDLLGRIKSTFHRESLETEQQVIDAVTRCDLLVVDEVGRSLDTNYEVAQFFRVLDIRYRERRPVLLVSNLNQVKLRGFLGDAVVDRLREAGGDLLVFDWASSRSVRAPRGEDA